MSEISPMNLKALQALCTAFKGELAERISQDERFIAVMLDITAEFVDNEIGLTNDDASYELGMMMLDSLTLRPFQQ